MAEDAGSWNQAVGVYVVEAVERFTNAQQSSALLAEQVVGERSYPLLSDWWNMFVSYLPGQANRPSIAGEVGAYFSSNATTMPPSSVTSAKLNLSTTGAVVFFFLWGIVLALVPRYYMSARGGSPLYFIGSGGVTFVLGTWVADAPVTMLQTGLVMFAILAYVGKRQYTKYERRRAMEATKNINPNP